jgi:8-oxo-dGTP pyrophosphatase MutT (NUDIX family)
MDFDQVAAVCYRWHKGKILILLVQSSGRRWIFPKGTIEEGETPSEAALREAHEEAGVSGAISPEPIAIFRHLKRDLKVRGLELRIGAYLLRVEQAYAPLEQHRAPAWFSIEAAMRAAADGREFEYAREMQDVLRKAQAAIEQIPAGERVELDLPSDVRPVDAPTLDAGHSPAKDGALFISYARIDADFVDWLAASLHDRGYAAWIDRKNIHPGEIWDDKIDAALRACSTMLLVLSPDSVASEAVSEEWKFFLSEGKLVIPLLIRECRPHFRLAKLQYIDFRSDQEQGLSALIRWLGDR